MKRIKLNDISGFSFAELMVVIALVGILSAIAVPNYLRSLPEKRLKNAARNLYADLQKARLLAVKSNTDVTVTFRTDEKTYSYLNGDEIITVMLKEFSPAIEYGCTAVETNWEGLQIGADDPIVPRKDDINTPVKFESVGTVKYEDETVLPNPVGERRVNVYLKSGNNNNVCYAVTINALGSVKIRRYGGSWE